jgi:hypothetical protein
VKLKERLYQKYLTTKRIDNETEYLKGTEHDITGVKRMGFEVLKKLTSEQ